MKETRDIQLPKGGTLEVEILPGFYDTVRKHFALPIGSYVSDDHIRMFVFGSLKTAVDKAEQDERNERLEANTQ